MAQLPPPRPRFTREQLLAERAKFREQRPGRVVLDPVKAEAGASKTAYIGAEWPVITLPADEIFHEGYVGVAGSGLGFNLDAIGEIFSFNPLGFVAIKNLVAAASTNVFTAKWAFNYVPTGDGLCNVSTSVFGFGNYKLISADGPGDSHEVAAEVKAVLQTSYGLSDVQTLFERTGANINEYAEFGQGLELVTGMEVKKGVPVQIDVGFIATVWARGDDTDAEIFMTKDSGGGFICAGVSVEDHTGLLPQ